MSNYFYEPGEQHTQDGVMDIVSDQYGDFIRQDKDSDFGTDHYDYNGNYAGTTIDGVNYDASGNRIDD